MSLKEQMTALANGVRELSGTSAKKGISAMASDVNAANTEIAEQAELLEQITTALEGKAAGGGSVETYTVTINIAENAYTSPFYCILTIIEDGVVTSRVVKESSVYNVVKDSEIIYFYPEGGGLIDFGQSSQYTKEFYTEMSSSSGMSIVCCSRKFDCDALTITVY